MRDGTRWRITGTFTTSAPMHVGCGAVVEDPRLKNEKNKEFCDVQAVTTDYQGRPCIPGTAVKGVLRAWAEQFFPKDAAIDRVFGKRESGQADAEAGRAEFHTAFQPEGTTYPETHPHVPYWNATSGTGISSSVGINHVTGAAERNKLFFEEFVPEGVTFAVEVTLAKATAADVAFLLAVLEHGANHATHPYQFGASGADGWGRMEWKLGAVTTWDGKPSAEVGFHCCKSKAVLPALPAPTAAPPAHQSFALTLNFDGPFLVNDTSRTHRDTDDGLPNFTPLRRADGGVWLPASSFRGALRSRAEFLLLSQNPNATGDPNKPPPKVAGPVERLFGTTAAASRLTVEEFKEVEEVVRCELRHQDFVAIDRFTGGAAEGAKFDAKYADRPTVRTTLVLDTAVELTEAEKKKKPEDQQQILATKKEQLAKAESLLALALRDVCRGEVTFGFGGSKGYGVATGTLCDDGHKWLEKHCSTATPPAGEAVESAPTANPLRQDVLEVEPNKNPKAKPVRFLRSTRAGGEKAPWAELSKDIQENDTVGTFDVEYETADGKPVRIRYQGKSYIATAAAMAALKSEKPTPSPREGMFAHPYYFLRMEDREKFTGDLKDAPPATHAKYEPDRYSGTLRVRLTTKTPLLLLETDRNERNPNRPIQRPDDPKDHLCYSVRKDADGKPLLASSSVRGMLRAAYEAITNSRFGVFPSKPDAPTLRQGNARRYGYRMSAGEGLSLIPVRIEGDRAHLMLGTNSGLPSYDPGKKRWAVPGGLLHAAWVFRYRAGVGGVHQDALRLNRQLPAHGQRGWCWLERIQHYRWDNRAGDYAPDFSFWAVRSAANTEAELSPAPPPLIPPSDTYRSTAETMRVGGYFFVSNQNIDKKHDERFFFSTPETASNSVVLSEEVRASYTALVADYAAVHDDELRARVQKGQSPDAYLGRTPGQTAWSRHVYDASGEVRGGHLCYALARRTGATYTIDTLYPVMISRRLYDLSPRDLLPAKLRPATALTDLSPADRVFGWVSQQKVTADAGEPAHKSLVRVGPVRYVPAEKPPVHTFDEPQPLAILGQPKPAQGRFYLGKSDGTAQDPGVPKEQAGYTRTADEKRRNRIRGPKVYPHHQSGPKIEDVNAGQPKHWIAPEGPNQKSNQNRSIREWVNDGVTFEFDLKVTNLSAVELGALVWLLTLPDKQFLRLGLGKPLGFGSVRAEIVESRVNTGAEWVKAMPAGEPPPADLKSFAADFEKAISDAKLDVLKAFGVAAAGFADLSIQYPPPQPADYPRDNPNDGGEKHFQWFGVNEGKNRPRPPGVSLPDLTADPSLPTRPN